MQICLIVQSTQRAFLTLLRIVRRRTVKIKAKMCHERICTGKVYSLIHFLLFDAKCLPRFHLVFTTLFEADRPINQSKAFDEKKRLGLETVTEIKLLGSVG